MSVCPSVYVHPKGKQEWTTDTPLTCFTFHHISGTKDVYCVQFYIILEYKLKYNTVSALFQLYPKQS